MSTPGSNLLARAFHIIAQQTVTYYAYLSRSKTAIGTLVATYDDPVAMRGSFQVVPRNLYAQYGLDFNKSYATFYTTADVLDIQRDVSGDQIEFNNFRWQVESSNDWFAVDGWVGVLCIRVPQPPSV